VTNNDQMIVIGLRALREFVRAFQDEIDEKRKPLINIFQLMFPHLEKLMGHFCCKGDS
jgi:hypothetical protein